MKPRFVKRAETRLRIIRAAADLFHKQRARSTSPDQVIEASRTGKGQLVLSLFQKQRGPGPRSASDLSRRAGHGISSALVANRIYTEAISQMDSGVGLTAMMQHLNQFVMRSLAGSVFFFTLMAARLHRDLLTIELAGAGHPPAMLVSRDKKPRLLESRSAILGLLDDAVDGETTLKVRVQPGDRLVICTDGFTESFNSQQEMLGVEGLKKIVCDTAGLPLPMMKQQIIDRVTAWRSGPATDDMSLVVLEIDRAGSPDIGKSSSMAI